MFFEELADHFPHLGKALEGARIQKPPMLFVKESFMLSILFSLGLGIIAFGFSFSFHFSPLYSIIVTFVSFFLLFTLMLNRPMHISYKSETVVDGEIVSMIRFLILEIKTEDSIYDAIINTSNNFALTGIYLDEVIDKVKLGKTLEQSLIEAVETCPSQHLRNVYWQLLNSIQTGSDITSSLQVMLNDVVEEQRIKIEEYGRELNALSLMYMMIAIIIPTVGFTIISAVLTFAGYQIDLVLLIGLWFFLTFIQYMFLQMTASRRPAVEAY